MSFVSLGGDGSTKPTFFELIAAEKLMPSLKAATVYSLSVFAQRRHSLHRVLNYEDELFALITLVLDKQSLSSGSASFADGLYGLRRAPLDRSSEKQKLLDKRQQRLALCFQVGLPYLQAKLQKLYERSSHPPDFPFPPARAGEEGASAPTHKRWILWLRGWALVIFLRTYPFAHAASEGLKFCYQLMYLLGATPFYSPVLRLLQQHVVRVSRQELVQAEREKRQRRERQLKQARQGAWPRSFMLQCSMRVGYLLADHTRNALILSVFAFKLLEWWYTSAEQKLASQKKLPVPPPPPPLARNVDGILLPSDPADCPICRQKRTNPAMAVTSGYVFCYPCIFGQVSRYGCCPVTLLPANVDQIRRLYYSQ